MRFSEELVCERQSVCGQACKGPTLHRHLTNKLFGFQCMSSLHDRKHILLFLVVMWRANSSHLNLYRHSTTYARRHYRYDVLDSAPTCDPQSCMTCACSCAQTCVTRPLPSTTSLLQLPLTSCYGIVQTGRRLNTCSQSFRSLQHAHLSWSGALNFSGWEF
jgi:hypothetical protein